MSKIIIDNQSNASDIEALSAVQLVMQSGRISNGGKQYCYYSTTLSKLGISSFLNKKSDRFVVTRIADKS